MRRSALFSMIASLALLPASAAAQGNQETGGKAAQPTALPALPAPTAPAQPAPAAPPAPPPPNTWVETEETEALPPPPPPPAPEAAPGTAPAAAGSAAPKTVEVYQGDLPPYTGPMRMASPGMFITGLAVGGVGFIALFTGVGLAASGENDITCDDCQLTDEQSAGIGFMLGGGAALAIGALLIGAGARSVPDQPSWAKAVPAVSIGPRRATLRWTF